MAHIFHSGGDVTPSIYRPLSRHIRLPHTTSSMDEAAPAADGGISLAIIMLTECQALCGQLVMLYIVIELVKTTRSYNRLSI